MVKDNLALLLPIYGTAFQLLPRYVELEHPDCRTSNRHGEKCRVATTDPVPAAGEDRGKAGPESDQHGGPSDHSICHLKDTPDPQLTRKDAPRHGPEEQRMGRFNSRYFEEYK